MGQKARLYQVLLLLAISTLEKGRLQNEANKTFFWPNKKSRYAWIYCELSGFKTEICVLCFHFWKTVNVFFNCFNKSLKGL